MKALLLRIIAGALLLAAGAAPAELIIYSGTSKITRTGSAHTQQESLKLFVVVDHETANLTIVFFTSINGRKLYSSQTLTNQQFVEVIGLNGRTNIAISHPRSDCALSEGATSEGIFAQGAASTLAINTNSTVIFPKTMSSSGQSYYPDKASIDVASMTLSFDKANTFASNTTGEELEEAAARLSSLLEKQGYTLSP